MEFCPQFFAFCLKNQILIFRKENKSYFSNEINLWHSDENIIDFKILNNELKKEFIIVLCLIKINDSMKATTVQIVDVFKNQITEEFLIPQNLE